MSHSGWGDTHHEEGSTDVLQETLVPIVPSSNCVDSAAFSAHDASLIQSLIVCAGGAGRGPCKVGKGGDSFVFLQGDSGGPLTVEGENGAHTLVGIVSRKLDFVCGENGYDVYTKVAAFLPWIESTIKENGGMASCGFNISAPPTLGKRSLPNCPKSSV